MSGKSFAVIGLGQFGMTLAKELANADYDVLAIDDKDENIQEIADTVTYAVRADVREPGILKSLGVQNVDVAIIAVAENMEASITAHHAGEGPGRPACSGEGNEFPSWPDPGENWC
ncbi:MAG: NAD-binding protein [Ruminococcus sp.]